MSTILNGIFEQVLRSPTALKFPLDSPVKTSYAIVDLLHISGYHAQHRSCDAASEDSLFMGFLHKDDYRFLVVSIKHKG